jgi:hypothetical protein
MNEELASLSERIASQEKSQRFLQRIGLDPRQFVLFLGLFRTLSEREELSGPIGASRFNLSYLALYAGAIGVLPWSLMACTSIPAPVYLLLNLAIVFILTFLIMLRESANVLFNPAGFSVLAHAPIHSATYAAAKTTHIILAVLYLISGLALYPAIIGFMLHGAHWFWLITHLTAAFLIGLWTTLIICAFYGGLSRLLPAHLLKNISLWIQFIAWIALISVPICFPEVLSKLLTVRYAHSGWNWLPLIWFAEIGMQGCQGASWQVGRQGVIAIAATIPIIWLGMRSLSGNFIFNNSSTVQANPGWDLKKTVISRSWNALIRIATGSPLGLGAFCFVSKMMRCDWQYRRTILMQTWLLLVFILALTIAASRGAPPVSPFGGDSQSFMHVLPHIMGLIVMALCANLCYSDFPSVSWIYLVSPVSNLRAYTRGVFGALWISAIGLPHIILLPFLIRFWGWKEGSLATGFNLIIVSLYLAFEINLITGLPFSNPIDESRATRNATNFQVCGLMALAIPSSIHWAICQIRWLALSMGIILIIIIAFTIRWTLGEFDNEIRWNLHRMKSGISRFYQEIG